MTDFGYNVDIRLDIEVWSRKPVWEQRALASILLGSEPYWRPRRSEDKLRLRDLENILEAADRANELLCELDSNGSIPIDAKLPPTGWVFPSVIVAWVKKRRIPVAPAFEDLVAALDEQGLLSIPSRERRTGEEPVDPPINALVRQSLDKMIYALAASGQPTFREADLPQAVRTILDYSDKCGLKIDDATVRKYLREAIATVEGKGLRRGD